MAARSAALVDWNNTTRTTTTNASSPLCSLGEILPARHQDLQRADPGGILGVKHHGALDGRTPAGLLTYGRITTADAEGKIRCVTSAGELTNDQLDTSANARRPKVPNPAKLLRHVCEGLWNITCVMTQRHSAEILAEAFGNYFDR